MKAINTSNTTKTERTTKGAARSNHEAAEKRTLAELAEHWKQLERKTAEQRKEADTYYETILMEPIVETFVQNNRRQVTEPVECLILSVGTSYEPLVLDIKLLKPERVLFLYTEISEKYLAKVVEYCGLSADRYEKSMIHETEPLDIYREIKEAYLKWKKPEKIYIDFTGGTKAMAAAAAMAGAMIGVQLLYVGCTEYLPDFRKPNPGTEQLYYIDNPLEVFGDIEIEKALTLFGEYNYAGAAERLQALKEEIPDPAIRQELNFAYFLAKGYEAWDALDFPAAYEYICQLNREIRRDRKTHKQFLLMDYAEHLAAQEEVLSRLVKIPKLIAEKKQMEVLSDREYMIPLMFTMYTNAFIREQQEKYDMATLLLYRLLEMIEQRRLARYGLYVSCMEYKKIRYDFEQKPDLKGKTEEECFAQLKEDINGIKKALYGRTGNGYLPEQVSLLEGFVILQALGDPISMMESGRHLDKLKRIRSMVYLRNNSIFAHGLGPVGQADFLKFKKFVEELFRELCVIEYVSFAEEKRIMEWVNPMDSEYYSRTEE